jgi:lipoyl(octanoyl) transferase
VKNTPFSQKILRLEYILGLSWILGTMDLSDLINVMVQQELSIYKTQDYLQPEFQEKIALQSVKDFPMLSNFSVGSSSSSSSSPINEFWREKICEWSFQVVDHFNFSREVVCVSIHMLDRFLSTRSVDKNTFQLAAMTTLFVSIKLSEPGRLSMRSMIELSRGYFKVEQMVAMEMTILR